MTKALPALMAGMVVAGVAAVSGSAQPAGMTWKAAIGGETSDHGIQAQIFAPGTITINAGDTVAWTMATVFDHTVSFTSEGKPPDVVVPEKGGKFLFNPLIVFPQGGKGYDGRGRASSGLLHPKGSYTLTFTAPGRYAYMCLLHPGMTGTVIVHPAGQKVAAAQADYDTLGQQQVTAALRKGLALLASTTVSFVKTANGTTYLSPVVGTMSGRASVIRFVPEALTIKAGDAVRWVMRDPMELHTVTFSGTERPPPTLTLRGPQMLGQPKIYFNPTVVAPSGGAVHTGDGYYNSGLMGLSAPGPKTYTVTFTRPGTYTYWCAVHGAQGMRGIIRVE